MDLLSLSVTKVDTEKMLVFGFASVSVTKDGQAVVDSQKDAIPLSELEKAAYDYVLNSRDGALMHRKNKVARLVESFVVTPEKLAALSLAEDALPLGWIVGFKVDDPEVWEKVKSGELKGFSIGGKAIRREAA